MPKRPQPNPHTRPLHDIAASHVLSFVDERALDVLLQPLLSDAGDRAFVVRCLIGEGPLHHRGANYILLSLLSQVTQLTSSVRPLNTESVPVPLRLPPHLEEAVNDPHYPLSLPVGVLKKMAGGNPQKLAAMIDCLTDGPPQHALANVVMVTMLSAQIEKTLRLETPKP